VFAIVFFAVAAAAFEVTPNEWSATALRDWLDAGRLKGAGPVVFSAAMLIGRLRGDRVIDRIGEARLLALSLGSIAVGYVVLIVAPNALVALVAFALWGLGVSVMFPQIYLMAARMNPEHPGAGLAAMTLAQRIGFMTATSSMGALSAGVGYGWAFTTIFGVAALLWVAALTLSSPSSRDTHGAHQ
jgi:predicted MFS family arabinose efflux permease